MSAVLLVRHGQASFGAADYDQLSPEGEEQSRIWVPHSRSAASSRRTPCAVA